MSFNKQSSKSRGTENLYHEGDSFSLGKSLSWQEAHDQGEQESSYGNEMARSGGSRAKTNPWAKQAPYLEDMFAEAKRVYENEWTDAAQGAKAAYGAGAEQFQDRMGEIAGTQARHNMGWDTLMGRQERATERFDTLVDDIMGYGIRDAQQEATEFAQNNPYLEQAIEQSYDNAEDLLARQLGGPGGLEHEAAMGRNMSSSRAGVAQGVAAAELADKAQANELAMRQAAYEQGLGQAGQIQQGRAAMTSLLKQDPGVMTSIMAAATAGDYNAQSMLSDLAVQSMLANVSGAETMYTPFQAYYPVIGSQVYGQESEAFEEAEASESGFQRDKHSSKKWGKGKTDTSDSTKASGSSRGTTTSRNDSSGFGFNLANFIGF